MFYCVYHIAHDAGDKSSPIVYDVTGVLLNRNVHPRCTFVIAAKGKRQVVDIFAHVFLIHEFTAI